MAEARPLSLAEIMGEQLAEQLSGEKAMTPSQTTLPHPPASAWNQPPTLPRDSEQPSMELPEISESDLGMMTAMGMDEQASKLAYRLSGNLEEAVALCLEQDRSQLETAVAQLTGRQLPKTQQDTSDGTSGMAENEVASEQEQEQGPEMDEDLALALALQEEERRRARAEGAARGGGGRGHRSVVTAPRGPGGEEGGGRGAEEEEEEEEEEGDWEEEEEGDWEEEEDEEAAWEAAEAARAAARDPPLVLADGGGGGRARGGGRYGGDVLRLADGRLVSKHDAWLCGRANAKALSDQHFKEVGDLDGAGVALPNQAAGQLRAALGKGGGRRRRKGQASSGARVAAEQRRTRGGVLDARTEELLFKLRNQGVLEEVHGAVKTGKEAHLLFATGRLALAADRGLRADADLARGAVAELPVTPVAVKVFKTTLNKFGNRADYIDGDARYGNLKFNKQGRRAMFKLWAEKEHRNLLRAAAAGVRCPAPGTQLEHLLVMEFIGTDGWPAAQLKEIHLSAAGGRRAYLQVLEECRKLFHNAALIHGDLSEYNILYKDKEIYLIDFGQAVERTHADAFRYLERDLNSINRFFTGKEVKIIPTEVAVHFILNCRVPSEEIIDKLLKWDVEANQQWDPDATLLRHATELLMREGGIDSVMTPEEVQRSLEFATYKRGAREGDYLGLDENQPDEGASEESATSEERGCSRNPPPSCAEEGGDNTQGEGIVMMNDGTPQQEKSEMSNGHCGAAGLEEEDDKQSKSYINTASTTSGDKAEKGGAVKN